ncbi:MAG: primase-helicase family protein [bacterium]
MSNKTGTTTNELKSYSYSYNPQITPGMTKDEGGKKTKGWIFNKIDWDEKELTRMIRTQSYTSSELKDGYKIKSNVKEVHNIILDFDKGTPTFYEFIEKAKEYQFAWVAHTTINHQKPKKDKETGEEIPGSEVDKFRVIIPLRLPITESAYNSCETFWVEKFPNIDTTSFQGNRYFMVNPAAEVVFHNTYIDKNGTTQVAMFIDPYEAKMVAESFKKKSIGRPKLFQLDNEKNLDGNYSIDDMVKLQDGSEIKYRDITGKTQVLCPFCNPANRQNPDKHNAFIDFNSAGQIYLYCSSENKTFWSHSSEIVSSKSSLFFNETLGYPSRIIESESEQENNRNGYFVFKNNDDWRNYCHYNNVNPACKIYLPRVRIIFDPKKPSGLQEDYFNMFQESEYLKNHDDAGILLSCSEVLIRMKTQTPVIYELMLNIFGEEEYLSRFLNWNAVILKDRIKVDTAWLITSKLQGIGKGLMFDRILQPIYGKRQSMLVQGERMAKTFNSQDQTQWLRVYDEVYTPGNPKENLSRKEWLKYIITAREQTIELKGIDSFQMANHMNLILYSNNECPIFLDNQDRRFNVIRNENVKKTENLSFYKSNIEMRNQIDNELPIFADLLLCYDYDVEQANTAINTTAKEQLKEITSDEYEEFAKALKNCDASFFLLSEIFPPSSSEKFLDHYTILSPEGLDVEAAIKKGYIPAKSMNAICKYHFRNYYKNILARLRLKRIEKSSKKEMNIVKTVYTIK